MTVDHAFTELTDRLGCPAAVCVDRELQSAEIRQRYKFVDWPDWSDGYAEAGPMPSVPMLILRYSKGINVATFNEGGARPGLNVWTRFAEAFFPLGECARTLDLNENAELRIAETTHRAYLAVADVTECEQQPLRSERLAGLSAHLGEPGRSVVVIGPPEDIREIRLAWSHDQ